MSVAAMSPTVTMTELAGGHLLHTERPRMRAHRPTRELDGVPHAVVGLTALFAVMLALLVAFMWLASPPTAVVFALVAIPLLVSSLARKAARERGAESSR